MVTWGLERVEVGGRAGTLDPRRRVEGNVEITLAGIDGGGGGFEGIDLDGRGGSDGGASGIWVTTSDELNIGDCPSVGLVRASKPGPVGRLGELVMDPVALVRVDRP